MDRIKTIVIEDEPLARKRIEQTVRKIAALELLGSFENPTDALVIVETGIVDLILSDIEMPDMDGISFIKSLDHLPFVVFITGHPEFAVESFELEAVDYIMKNSLTEERLLKTVNKVRKAMLYRRDHPNNRRYIPIKDRTKTLFVDSVDILYVKAMGDYVQIHMLQKKHTTLSTLADMESQLSRKDFIRIHRSFIVNANYIESVSKGVTLKGGVMLPIGESYKKLLNERLGL